MKNKTPKTISDLKINWTFCKGEGGIAIEETKVFSQFRELNHEICNLVIKKDFYKFHFKSREFTMYSLSNESLASFITFLNYIIWMDFGKDIKLKKFQRVSDTEYIIDGE